MRTAAAYIRVSTEEQTEFSPNAQLSAIQLYAGKNGYMIPEAYIFRDEGISGRTADKRPAFQQMIALGKKKPRPFDAILIHKFDRFARNREDSVVYKSLLRRECGIQVISITEQLEDDKFAVILEAMLEAMAEYYSLNLSDEVKKGMVEKARRGGTMWKSPFGYRNVDHSAPKIVPAEAEAVRMMFHKVASGELTPFTLAKHLNDRGILTRDGRRWSAYTVKYVLANPYYTGVTVWNRTTRATMTRKSQEDWITAKGEHMAVVDQALFEEVQRVLAMHKTRRERPAATYVHWLSGLVKCSNCGASLSVSGVRYPHFQCHRYNKGDCHRSHYAPVTAVENAVIASLNGFVGQAQPGVYYEKRSVDSVDSWNDITLLHIALKKEQEKLKRIKAAFSAGIDTLDEYRENKVVVMTQIDSIGAQIQKMTAQNADKDVRRTAIGIACVLDVIQSVDNTLAEKNAALKSFIKKIVFDKSNRRIQVFYYYD